MSGRILQGYNLKPTISDDITLGEFFLRQAKQFPDKICQIDADLDRSETYASVLNRSIRLAIQLQKRGVTSEDVVTCCSNNSLDNSIAIIATLLLGAKISNLDPTLSARTTQHLLRLVTPKVVFSDLESLPLIESCLKDVGFDSEVIVLGTSPDHTQFSDLLQLEVDATGFVPPKVSVHDVAVMFFSSGTTGLPKAICHSHFTCLQMIQMIMDKGIDIRVLLQFTTMYWISGMMMLIQVFFNGDTRVFARNMVPEATFQILEKYKVTCLFTAPINAYKLLTVEHPERYDYSSLRTFLMGGTPVSAQQIKRLETLFPEGNISYGYGLSEVGIISLFNCKTEKHFIRSKIGSSGTIGANTTLKIVDPATGVILGPGQQGEIRVKCMSMMVGYYKQDNAENFDDDGFLKTGDVGYYDEDECIYVVDRMKEMFKYLSWHIVPSMLESVLYEHPAVQETVIFGIPTGEEGEAPAACVVLKEGYENDVSKDELEQFVQERVSDRERLRGGIMFVQSLPKTPSGKLKRNEVRNTFIRTK